MIDLKFSNWKAQIQTLNNIESSIKAHNTAINVLKHIEQLEHQCNIRKATHCNIASASLRRGHRPGPDAECLQDRARHNSIFFEFFD